MSMSDDAQLTTYEVELTMMATAYVTVEAEDEDAAHDLAKEQGYHISPGDWDTDKITVEGMRETAA